MAVVQHRSSRVIRSVSGWMNTALAQGKPVSREQVQAWLAALMTTNEQLEQREAAVEMAEANQVAFAGSGPVDLAYAERLQDGVTASVKRLAYLAEQAATVKELVEIDLGACAILDAFEALAHGVARPAATPDIGA